MKIFVFLIIASLVPGPALAQIVVLPSTELSRDDFARLIHNVPNGVRPSNAVIQSLPQKTNSHLLLESFEQAQSLFLSGSLDEARLAFSRITDMAFNDDWNPIEQRYLVFSFLRLAQLEKNADKRREWVRASTNWKALETKNLDIFPPPLIANYTEELRILKNRNSLWRPNITYPVRFVIINGSVHSYRPGKRLPLPSGKARITLVSDFFETQTRILEPQAIPLAEFRGPNSWLQGTCESPNVENGKLPAHEEVYALFSKDCLKVKDADYWVLQAEKGEKRKLQLMPQVNTESFRAAPPKAIWEKPWFWVAAAAATAVIVAVVQSQKNKGAGDSTAPTQRTADP